MATTTALPPPGPCRLHRQLVPCPTDTDPYTTGEFAIANQAKQSALTICR